ncbi:hydrolase, TatD family [[Eubacterium] yurii subsp. margaretiae ATCC 43715]|nr:hydrolase, TatD family [[Eubacterium] yurii subsp. margaretiae ATCC 43715]
MIFDTHAHLDSEQFEEDFEDIIQNIINNNISLIVNPGCDLPTSKKSVELSEKYDFIYSAVGFHPHEAKYMDEEAINEIERLANSNKKVVSIGEIGLDYYYDFSPRDIQEDVFIKQMALANKLNLPFIIHSRDASNDTFEMVKKYKNNVDCVLHCYSQSKEMAKLYLDLGCYLSFAGPVTFKKSTNLQEVAKYAPLDRIFIETDSPYLSPEPKRGKKNEPSNVIYTGKKIAELKGISEEQLFKSTYNNGVRFFKLDEKFGINQL